MRRFGLGALFGLFAVCFADGQTLPTGLSPQSAADYQGKTANICGVVEAFVCNASEGVTLTFGAQSKFRALIAPEARTDKRVEERFIDRQVCVSGLVEQAGPGHQIVVKNLDQITIHAQSYLRVFAPHAYRAGCDPGLVLPKLISEQKPAYTRLAMQAGVQGAVWVEAVVEADGKVGDVWVMRSLRNDLDKQAVLAAKEWRFEPGTLNQQPVPIIVTIELTFTLKRDAPPYR